MMNNNNGLTVLDIQSRTGYKELQKSLSIFRSIPNKSLEQVQGLYEFLKYRAEQVANLIEFDNLLSLSDCKTVLDQETTKAMYRELIELNNILDLGLLDES